MKHFLKLWPDFKYYRTPFIISIMLGAIMSLCQGSVTYLLEMLYNDVFIDKNEELVWQIPLVFIGIYFINGLARYFHLFLMRYTADRVAVRLRESLQRKFTSLNVHFYNTYPGGTGGLLSRTLNDVSVVQEGLRYIADIVREPILAVALLFYMFTHDAPLTFFCLIVLPLLFQALKKLGYSLRKYGHYSQNSLETITTTLKESLDGVRIIQSFNLENHISKRFRADVQDFLNNRKKIISREESAGPISEWLGSFVFAGLCIYMGQQIIGGVSTVGEFTGFLAALGFMQKPLKKLQEAFIKLQQTGVTLQRIFEIIDHTSTVPESLESKPFPKQWHKISYQNVHFSYGQTPILKDINFEIHRGQKIALVGESGSGKSTLVNLLERFFDPTQGTISIGDLPIQEIDLRKLRKNIALVTQDVFLFSDTIANNIAMGDLEKDRSQIQAAAEMANAHSFIKKLAKDYETRVGERGSLLSGGEKQRISIARAIYKDAPILILDEATSALDSASELEVQKGLDQLMEGRTSFIIAHRLSTIQHADLILVMKDGQIVETGSHSELLSRQGAYWRFHQLQSTSANEEEAVPV